MHYSLIFLFFIYSVRSLPQRHPNSDTTKIFAELLQNPSFEDFLAELHSKFQETQKTAASTTEQPLGLIDNHRKSNYFVNLDKEVPTIPHSVNTPRTRHIVRKLSSTTTETPSFTTQQALEPSPVNKLEETFKAFRTTVKVPPAVPSVQTQQELDNAFKEQARSAKYSFASAIDDTISGQQHERQEVRDGLKVRGKYSYSDGFYQRSVEYEADEKGYRVLNETAVAIGNGPSYNPDGNAQVATYQDGNSVKYRITGEDIRGAVRNKQVFVEDEEERA